MKTSLIAVVLLIVLLLWQDNSDNENGFIIEKTVSGNCAEGFEVFVYVGVNVTSITDNIANRGDCYRVAAFNEYGISEYSNTAQVEKPCKGKNCR